MTRLLIINADDYGLSPGVSAGILRAAQGLVTSTTVLVNLVTRLEVKFLIGAAAGGALGAGIHLNLTCGRPLTRDYPAALRDDYGAFDKAVALAEATWSEPAHRDAARREWRAQLKQLLSYGVQPDHIDSHHHAHLLDPLFPLALELAVELGLPLRARSAQREVCTQNCVPTVDTFVEGFYGTNWVSAENLLFELDKATGDTVEVMCHPGLTDGLLKLRSSYRQERELELVTLSGAHLREEVTKRGWRLGGFNNLR
ncbi:ChbG/HpnK family deacetylase [bacterium]|nr:ChbG/HpnK family deacetylase [bacterium]